MNILLDIRRYSLDLKYLVLSEKHNYLKYNKGPVGQKMFSLYKAF